MYSGLENSMDCMVHGVAESDTTEQLSLSLLEKTLMLEGIGGRRRKGQHRMRWLDGITDSIWT